ncbi:alpha/beta hydrolase [Microbacterium sp. GXF6406]
MTLHAISAEPIPSDATIVAVLLHGYGSNERDLVSLAASLPAGMPWVSLRAPIEVAPGGHAWFRIVTPGHPEQDALDAATAAILDWADAALPAGARLVPIGFSQGGLMATQLLRTAPERVLAPVVLGGFVQAGEQPADAALREERPAMFLGRGAEDRVIHPAAIERTDLWAPRHTTLTDRRYPGLGHGISAEELADVRDFLAASATEQTR